MLRPERARFVELLERERDQLLVRRDTELAAYELRQFRYGVPPVAVPPGHGGSPTEHVKALLHLVVCDQLITDLPQQKQALYNYQRKSLVYVKNL